jgi:hypothetical protein
MKATATVKIFLARGEPDSVRTAEISNWTGKAVAGPRSQLDQILRRDEAANPGVYFLTGVNPETGKLRVYIGEAEVIRSRIKNHLDLDFWKTIIFFVSKDENLTKAHIKYLEGKLIDMARSADRYEVANTNSSGARLPESDSADMDIFLSKIEQLLPVLGQDFLKTIAQPSESCGESGLLTCTIKGLSARGRVTENGFLVRKGSEAVLRERPSSAKYPYALTLRLQLRAEEVLIEQEDKLVFARDYEFSSPSAAAAVVHGGHANGLREWKDAKGIPLKELESIDIDTDID